MLLLPGGRWWTIILLTWTIISVSCDVNKDSGATNSGPKGNKASLNVEDRVRGYVILRSDTPDIQDRPKTNGLIIITPRDIANELWLSLGFDAKGPSVLNKMSMKVSPKDLPARSYIAKIEEDGSFAIPSTTSAIYCLVDTRFTMGDQYQVVGCALAETDQMIKPLVIDVGIAGVTIDEN